MNLKILDLQISNIRSVVNAFRVVGHDPQVIKTAGEIVGADLLVLPGVGAFRAAMKRIREAGLADPLRRHALEEKKPLLGICLGMQLLADRSEENGDTEGLGLIPGTVLRLNGDQEGVAVPNIGWHEVQKTRTDSLFPTALDGAYFYHVHSYHLVPREDEAVAATIMFGHDRIATAVQKGNIAGVQFHPEKSQDAGLNLIASIMAGFGRLPRMRLRDNASGLLALSTNGDESS